MSITVNPNALGWKHNHAEGINCKEDENGDMVLTAWPSSLGQMPSQSECDAWADEYDLWKASSETITAINTMRDQKKTLPILSEGEQVDVGTLSSGAMANELFAYDGKSMSVSTITRSGDTVAVTFDKNHHLDTGQRFAPSGADQPEYNDEFTATVVDKKTVTCTVLGSPPTPATGNITALTTDYPWIDHLNNSVFWSASKFKAIHRDATKYDRDCVRHGRTLKDMVIACDTIAEIQYILDNDLDTGWPDTGL